MANIKDAIRDIWAANTTLTDEVNVDTDESNRFFEDGVPEVPEGATGGNYVSITDFGGPVLLRSSSGTVREGNLLIIIATDAKQTTEMLYATFKQDIESNLRGTVTDMGSVCDLVFQSPLFQRTENGYFECQVNLELTQSE